MNTKHTIAMISVGFVGLLTFAGVASATPPSPTVDLSAAKAKCDATVTQRTAEIDKLTAKASAAKNLSASHHSTIDAFLSTSRSGLVDLQAKIDADTDAATLKADCQNVFAGFRVFALRAPQVHLAIVGDRQIAVIARGNNVATKLDAAIQKAAANGKDVTDATAKLADMNAKLADAASLVNGVVDNELTFTPDQWNANHSLLSPTTTALRSAQQDVVTALADGRAIVADLKA
jgi:hypothetical protein